ncbi:D-3-phosphoglycerate dehydrogenase [Arabidopsis thaliana]|jgi:D-3-phosphoglycerate dehydrogenase|uniref:D-3-phosphoglycerate dehydrogenase 2, chloroplastic n=4 Tax=Arabidopsis TaxID=3701 RepID=SERA2_ARATH|nr:D-3-phosphoglycerate dehydrogenase [Arabidopsis thaliana]O04130.2 RecName: Full=D-3-phosphoglycerate dehydrogenase 2, chloroplastic; Short=PGDH; Flags: Precursor [Arabidopsis thaliana]KAG7646680.1 ACT domain [Arabidopsis thaliana x Arabidopsis arenosa]KAG7654660.1 ACT domain [Arabidopsis suecica]AAF99816.1 D-3-phosphoglycerate dehydrogenase [Arabidopsis thaliana]AAK91415.1 At1g17740/F11A6_16 [Arabidopsis thaliana]AAM19963.1 At1g17740/F11A6_16 [Arabidopsis thaliana]|eukprot:NP_564034.1 D-3-phosphoglycerate dehydrogenase [Arabidopsis thaliana]
MAFSSSCSSVKAVNSRWTSPSPSPSSRFAVLPAFLHRRYATSVKLTAISAALKTVEQTTLTEDNRFSTVGSDSDEYNPTLPKPRILVTEKLGEAGVNLLREFGDVDCSYDLSPEDLKKKVAESDALIVRSGTKVTREVFEAAKGRLKVVGRAGVGIDNVDLQAATEHGCLVVNAPTANTVAAAEHGIALLASMARNVAQADASIKAGKWERSKYVGVSLVGKTLAVMGFGKVGTEVARRAKGLGMTVISHDPYAPADRARALGVDLVSFDQAISTADFVSLHMPLTPATKKVFNDETFSKMKKGVRLINVARGGVIDEDALVRALDAGIVAQAALDVFCEEPPSKDSRLIQHENVTVTPHLGASTKEAQEGVAIEIAEAVAGALKGELSATAVNAPMVAPEVLSELTPYIVLAEKLGRLAVQLASGGKGVQSIRVVYRSARDRDDLDTRLLRAMITKGIIEPISDSYVNLVNADFIAKQKGLRISEERMVVDSSPEYPVDSIQVQILNVESNFAGAVSDAGDISIEGKVKYGVPHLTCVGSFGVDVSLEGNLILCRQVDQPGMIGQVGNILGEQNVNVNFMSVGRTVLRKQAIMAIGVDEEPDNKTLERIGGVSAIEEFVFLKL